jgi:hypothetical protein
MSKGMMTGMVLLMLTVGHANAANDGNQFIHDCRQAIAFIDSKPVGDQVAYLQAGTCIGTANGVITSEMINQATQPGKALICLPDNISPPQAVRIADKYMTEHPEKLQYPSGAIMHAALMNAFPCKGK